MKKITTLVLIMIVNICFSQQIKFTPIDLIIDNDTLKIETQDLIKINLTDDIFIETSSDKNDIIISSNKSKIKNESVNNGVVTFETFNGVLYKLIILEEFATLEVEGDNLKWIGTYKIDFSIMLKRNK